MSSLNYQTSRRWMIQSLASASMLLPGMLHEMLAAETAGSADPNDPLAPKAPMFPAKAKRVIFLYMSGGVSHVDTFDPKPKFWPPATARNTKRISCTPAPGHLNRMARRVPKSAICFRTSAPAWTTFA